MGYKPILFNTEMVHAIQAGRKTQTRRVVRKKYDNTDLVMFTNKYGTRLVERQNDAPPPRKYTDVNGVRHTVTHMVAQRELDQPCKHGDILWVRETWDYSEGEYRYKADDEMPDGWHATAWHPSIHMPKEAARIFLRVKDVRVERLCQITPQDAVREGISRLFDHMTKAEYEEWANRSGVKVPQHEQSWNNYLWHGHFGAHGMGNQMSNAWPWQASGYECPRLSFSSLWNSTVQLKDWDKYGWDANPWVWVIEFERCEKPKDFD